jgi:hypothetical protein
LYVSYTPTNNYVELVCTNQKRVRILWYLLVPLHIFFHNGRNAPPPSILSMGLLHEAITHTESHEIDGCNEEENMEQGENKLTA